MIIEIVTDIFPQCSYNVNSTNIPGLFTSVHFRYIQAAQQTILYLKIFLLYLSKQIKKYIFKCLLNINDNVSKVIMRISNTHPENIYDFSTFLNFNTLLVLRQVWSNRKRKQVQEAPSTQKACVLQTWKHDTKVRSTSWIPVPIKCISHGGCCGSIASVWIQSCKFLDTMN